MKPMILNFDELEESIEIYESKPNPFIIYTIYTVFVILVIAVLWMIFFDIENLVKGNGIFKGIDENFDVGSSVSGVVKEKYVSDGKFVKEGDLLYNIEIESLSDEIILYQKNIANIQERLLMLDAFDESLNGDSDSLEMLSENQYYEEFKNRRVLLFQNIKNSIENIDDRESLYDESIKSITENIEKNNLKIDLINKVKTCVISRSNTINTEESYYYSIVDSYISSYNLTAMQYDAKISGYNAKIAEINKEIEKNIISELNDLNKSKQEYITNIDLTQLEKMQALKNIENQKMLELEQIIEQINSSLVSLNSNVEAVKLEKSSILDSSNKNNEKIAILTEKGNIANEKNSLKEKKEEYENYLNKYNIQNKNCNITAKSSGYYYDTQSLKRGSFIKEGSTIGKIFPESQSGFFAEVYVKNTDIGKVKENQSVNLEISAYPSMEYGYFKGKIVSISKDITVDENTGNAYYIAKVKCENMTVKSKNGDVGKLKNGMACQAKIIIGKKSIMTYILEKINLLD